MVAPGWAKRVPESAIGSPARMRSRVDLPAPLRPTSAQPLARRDGELDAVEDGLVAEVVADAGEGKQGRFGHGLDQVGRRFMTEPVHNGKCIGWR